MIIGLFPSGLHLSCNDKMASTEMGIARFASILYKNLKRERSLIVFRRNSFRLHFITRLEFDNLLSRKKHIFTCKRIMTITSFTLNN